MRASSWYLAVLGLIALIGVAVPASGYPATSVQCPNARSVNQPITDGDSSYLLDIEGVSTTPGTSCKKAGKVVDAYTKCRTKKDPFGYCTSKVLGYSCRESRTGYEDTRGGHVVCAKGKSYVAHKWYQRPGVPPAP
jgi:hypothetical protein